jgi:hypothetical protein
VSGWLLQLAAGRFTLARLMALGWLWLLHYGAAVVAVISGVGVAVAVVVGFERPRQRAGQLIRRLLLRPSLVRAARHAGVTGSDDAAVSVRRVQATPAGHRLLVELPLGSHAGALEKAAEAIAAALGVREVRVARDAGHAGRAWVSVVRRDTLGQAEPLRCPWRLVEMTSLWQGVPTGVDEDGRDKVLELIYHHLGVGGESGGGKSNLVQLVVAYAALDPGVDLLVCDGKLVELSRWRGCAQGFVGMAVADAVDLLGLLQAEIDERLGFMEQRASRKIVAGDGFRPKVFVVDEWAHYVSVGTTAEVKELNRRMLDVTSRGRGAGVACVVATQKPSAEVIPTALRDLLGYRLAFRCATREASDTILGSGWAAEGYSAARIAPACRGVGYLLADGGVPERIRCYYLTDDDLEGLVARAEALRAASRLAASEQVAP